MAKTKDRKPAISIEQWLRELRDVTEKGANSAYTVNELCEMTGFSPERMRKCIRDLTNAGKATCMHVKRRSIDGRLCRVPAYIITPR